VLVKLILIGFFLHLLILSSLDGVAQFLQIDSSYNITKSKGNDLFPSWSEDGSKLVFQSNRAGNWDVFEYELNTGKTIQLTNETANEQYPALLPNNDKLAFTSDKNDDEHLYFLNMKTGEQNRIFSREITAKAASFTSSGYQLYCLGYDATTKKWGIYRFEFKYNSLKLIRSLSDDSSLPQVSKDGEFVLYEELNPADRIREINIINWYGETEKIISGFNAFDASWDPAGLKIIFISDMDSPEGELYTIWRDGSHLERLTNDTMTLRNPVISPDRKQLAVSVLLDNGFDIFIIPFEDF